MPEAPTTYLGIILPTVGSDDGVWGTLLNTALGGVNSVDSHDHTTGKGKAVPSAGINIDAALNFNSQRAINVAGLDFVPVAALASGSSELYVDTADNNLKFRNAAGVNVRIINGNQLDVTTVGAIGGDYTSAGAEVAYVNANDWYTFKQETAAAVRQWAKMQSADLALYEYKAAGDPAVPTNAVTLRSPAALAGGYSLTFPGALPASQVVRQVSAAGVEVFSNTLPTLLTLSAGATAAAGQHFTVSTTGRYKHGDRERVQQFVPGDVRSGAPVFNVAGHATGVATYMQRIEIEVGRQIKSITLYYNRGGAGTIQVTYARRTGDGAGANLVTIAGAAIVAGAAYTSQTTAINHTALTGWSHWVEVVCDNAANIVHAIGVVYDEP